MALRWGRRTGLAVLALALLAFAGSCDDGPDEPLEALKSDPLAYVELEGAQFLRRTESPSEGGTKPTPATLMVTFQVTSGDYGSVLAELAESARASGWSLAPKDGGGFTGERRIGERRGWLVISGVEIENLVFATLHADR